jgi:hypothetical protein
MLGDPRRSGCVPGGTELAERRREQRWIEWDRTELPSQITNGSRAHLSVNRDMPRAISDEDTHTEIIRAHAVHHGFALAPIFQSFQLAKEALPHVVCDPTGSRTREPLARQADVQADIPTR